MASTTAGSVLSRTETDAFLKLAASTWTTRLEPPMPHTTTRATPSRCTSAAKRTRGSHNASEARRSEEHTSELQSLAYLVCRLLLEKKKKTNTRIESANVLQIMKD